MTDIPILNKDGVHVHGEQCYKYMGTCPEYISMKEPKTLTKYKSMCFDCAEKTYGKPKRDIGAITVSMGKCFMCKKQEAIIPARDLYYAHAPHVTAEDWD